MIQVAGLCKAFAEKVLFQNVDWAISRNDRIGLCGANGAGKTTLLRMLCGSESPDSGEILKPSSLRIGYLPQDGVTHAERTVFDEATLAFQELLDLKARLHETEERLGDPSLTEEEHEAQMNRYSQLQDRFRSADGYAMDLKVATVLCGLGFSKADYGRETGELSGGWQMRLALAKLLLSNPDLLLLDEPTNHLDLEARNWLESYLSSYPHAFVVISHDRFFLDAVVSRITEVGLKTLTDYTGGYSAYIAERDARIERLRDARRRQDEETARIKLFIDRFRYTASRAAQVQSRVKMLEKVTPIDVPPERKRVHFTFPTSPPGGRIAIELQGVHKAYGETVVFNGVDVHVERGDRIALVGPNGSGKSTLMRLLDGTDSPDQGSRHEGYQVVLQSFAQDEPMRLNPSLTVYETLAVDSPDHMIPSIRNILGGFLFSGDDVYKSVSALSGGERQRLAVARMLLRPSNTLLLDEPTNHLDLDSKEVLLDALLDYGGTLIFVSHDRYFLDRLATRVIEIGGERADAYPGGYEEFLDHKQRCEAEKTGAAGEAKATDVNQDSPARTAWEERKRLQAGSRKRERAIRNLKEKIAGMESRIAERESVVRDLETAMADLGFYEDYARSRAEIERHQRLVNEVGELMSEWEELQETLDTLLSQNQNGVDSTETPGESGPTDDGD